MATIRSTPPRRPSQPRSVTRTSYQVGRPWMLEGKMLRGLTGTPMRRMERANSSFALAEPEPLTFANLTTKSFTASMGFMVSSMPPCSRRLAPACGRPAAARRAGVGHLEEELLHVPGAGRAALGAQPAMQAHVLVLRHDAAGVEGLGDVERLVGIQRRRVQALTQVRLLAVLGERDAIHRTDVDARVALDAQARAEHGLGIAVEAALRLLERRGRIEPLLDLDPDVLERHAHVVPGHLEALIERYVVVVAPLVDAHLLRHQVHHRRRPGADVLVVAELVDRDR